MSDESLELYLYVVSGELPANFCSGLIYGYLSRSDLVAYCVGGIDVAMEALWDHWLFGLKISYIVIFLQNLFHWKVNIALGVVGGIFYRLEEGFARASCYLNDQEICSYLFTVSNQTCSQALTPSTFY